MATLASDAAALSGIMEAILGKTTTTKSSGGGSTTGLDISQEGIDAILKGILEGTSGKQGLASVASGQRTAGMYNTTATTQLLNDFLTRAAGETAKASAKQVTTKEDTTSTVKTAGALDTTAGKVGTAGILGLIAKSALSKGVEGAATKAVDAGVTKVLGSAPVSSSAAPTQAAITSTKDSILNAITGEKFDPVKADAVWSSNVDVFNESIADSVWSESANMFNETAADAIWSESASVGTELSSSTFEGSAGSGAGSYLGYFSAANDFFGSDGNKAKGAGEAIGTYFLPGIGTAVGGAIGEALDPVFNSIDDNIIQPVAGVVEDAWEGVTDVVSGAGNWISDIGDSCYITTATCLNSHKPDNCLELTSLREFRDSYMYKTPERRQELIEYYAESPLLVCKINSLSASVRDHIYSVMERFFILPAVVAFKSGDFEMTHRIYSALVRFAKEV